MIPFSLFNLPRFFSRFINKIAGVEYEDSDYDANEEEYYSEFGTFEFDDGYEYIDEYPSPDYTRETPIVSPSKSTSEKSAKELADEEAEKNWPWYELTLSDLMKKVNTNTLRNLNKHVHRSKARSFSDDLKYYMEKHNIKNSQCYKNALMDKNVFSRILHCDRDYCPAKSTVIQFCFAMHLSLEETEEFLRKTGYALTDRYGFDLIVTFMIMNEVYDLQILNECLEAYDLPPIIRVKG